MSMKRKKASAGNFLFLFIFGVLLFFILGEFFGLLLMFISIVGTLVIASKKSGEAKTPTGEERVRVAGGVMKENPRRPSFWG